MGQTHHFIPTTYHLTLGSHPPALHIKPGDTVLTSTVDASGCDATGEQVVGHGNAQTGPFYVEGAEPGDTLVVRFEHIYPNRTHGYSGCGLSSNVVEPTYVSHIPGEGVRSLWSLDLEAGTATLERPKLAIDPFTIELAPMLGCFGVAPAGGQAISARTGGNYGGNMDYRGIVPGVTVYLPVFVDGALLHVGDGHGAQGDGEILGRGIEVSCDVTFTVDLIKAGEAGALRGGDREWSGGGGSGGSVGGGSGGNAASGDGNGESATSGVGSGVATGQLAGGTPTSAGGLAIQWPRGENDDSIFTIGNARPLHQALQHATTEMLRWLQADYRLDAPTAHMLLGQYVRYEVGNVFNPAYTMVCKLEKRHLPAAGS